MSRAAGPRAALVPLHALPVLSQTGSQVPPASVGTGSAPLPMRAVLSSHTAVPFPAVARDGRASSSPKRRSPGAERPSSKALVTYTSTGARPAIARLVREDGAVSPEEERIEALLASLHAEASEYEQWRAVGDAYRRCGPNAHTWRLAREAGWTVISGGHSDDPSPQAA